MGVRHIVMVKAEMKLCCWERGNVLNDSSQSYNDQTSHTCALRREYEKKSNFSGEL